ncbi:hypothetical protein [Sphaerisporangium sp. TRM90804]|nr:hypothetical protein [Sphaerisporangium sp. TRM90804]MDH2428289.1 hypothetical protein [Sphaerisporangium sp. TRM90804]
MIDALDDGSIVARLAAAFGRPPNVDVPLTSGHDLGSVWFEPDVA